MADRFTNERDVRRLGSSLSIPRHTVESILTNNKNDIWSAAYKVLQEWEKGQPYPTEVLESLRHALNTIGFCNLVCELLEPSDSDAQKRKTSCKVFLFNKYNKNTFDQDAYRQLVERIPVCPTLDVPHMEQTLPVGRCPLYAPEGRAHLNADPNLFKQKNMSQNITFSSRSVKIQASGRRVTPRNLLVGYVITNPSDCTRRVLCSLISTNNVIFLIISL